ncbi:MAG: hypothetical protein IKJ43_04760 [Bacilli bacterium]|nr:hypothetical protein [Bacilli bacterium]
MKKKIIVSLIIVVILFISAVLSYNYYKSYKQNEALKILSEKSNIPKEQFTFSKMKNDKEYEFKYNSETRNIKYVINVEKKTYKRIEKITIGG